MLRRKKDDFKVHVLGPLESKLKELSRELRSEKDPIKKESLKNELATLQVNKGKLLAWKADIDKQNKALKKTRVYTPQEEASPGLRFLRYHPIGKILSFMLLLKIKIRYTVKELLSK